MRVADCSNLSRHPLTGHWFRAINLRHWKTRLLTDYTRKVRSRFSSATPPLYRILYLGENHQVAIYEVGALLGDPNAPLSSPVGSWILMSLNIRLYSVIDLCDPDQQKLISTSDQELTGSWANNPAACPTQQLGAALYALPDAEGIKYPSSKAGSHNLAIFMDKLNKNSAISFKNELDGRTEMLV
jgi:RES domain